MAKPDSPVPEERTYTVTGTREYAGHAPGETFTAALSPEKEQRAIDRGSISLGEAKKADVAKPTPAPKAAPAAKEE